MFHVMIVVTVAPFPGHHHLMAVNDLTSVQLFKISFCRPYSPTLCDHLPLLLKTCNILLSQSIFQFNQFTAPL